MSKKLPTISVTTEQHTSHSESSSSQDSESNDMDYGRNGDAGGVTDVEDFDSQAEVLKPRSRRGSGPQSQQSKPKPKSNPFEIDVTDVEDYATDSDDEEKSTAYPELKLSLREFLQQGLQNQEAVDNDAKESCEIKAGNFLQAQNLNGLADYLTDCEDYDTDSEVDYGCEKSVCVDLDNAIGDQGRVNIADGEKHQDDSDQYEDVSVISDISDLASAMSDCTGIGVRGMSQDEMLEVSGSGSEEVCQIACSGSDSELEGAAAQSASDANYPPIDVAFVSASGQPRRNSKSTICLSERKGKHFLQLSGKNEEVLTDIEGIDDSAAEDSFDNEEDDEQPIPRAIILASGDDGTCLTDVEDIFCEDTSLSSCLPEITAVAPESLPLPHREVVELKEDKYGDTITNVMPMDRNYEFGIYNPYVKDAIHTDSEDYSCAEDWSLNQSIADDALVVGAGLIENEVIVSNELMKQQQNKRLEVLSNAESVTDVEEIFVAGTNRRKKLKTRTLSKGKNKLLDVVKKEDGITDVEDMDLSECDLPPGVKRVDQLKLQAKSQTADKLTDAEDLSTDDVSEASDAASPIPPSCDNTNNKMKLQPLYLRLQKEEVISQQNTDIEDVQLPSEAEDGLEAPSIQVANSNSKELNDMLNESYTVVHERTGQCFNADAEKLHIKGVIKDAHTDVEYVESDESAARGETLEEKTIDSSILDIKKISQGDVKVVGEGEDDNAVAVEVADDIDNDNDNKNEADLVARIREEATVLVDRVLEESVEILGQRPNGHESAKQEYNSESENYAITCDDIGGVDVIKSPTIESMSGKSFDDNMSFTDEHIHLPLHVQNIPIATTTIQFQEQQQVQLQPQPQPQAQPQPLFHVATATSSTSKVSSVDDDKLVMRSRRIDHKIEKLVADVDADVDVSLQFDEAFETAVQEDEISILQGEFSKLSWDDSVSPTTNTMADMAQNQITPDNDIQMQELISETGGDIPISNETTPVPPLAVVANTTTTDTAAKSVVDTTTSIITTTSHDTPTPKPRVLKASSPASEDTDSTTIPSQEQKPDIPIDISIDAAVPVPKPRAPIKHTEQVENLAALGEQSDSVSLRSFDFTEELSKTDEPSTELSIRSQLRDLVTTTATTNTTTTASEDHTESFEPTSEISVDDADTEKSEGAEKTTSFYIGESSRNVITKTTTKSASITPQEEEAPGELSFDAKDISLMKEVSVDSDEANDVFKEFVTMKRDDPAELDNKIVRQGSETRNDLLELENADKEKSVEPKLSKVTTEESLTTSTGSSGRAVIEIAPSSSEDPDESSKEIPEIVNTIAEKVMSTDKFELPLEKSEWETSEKDIPTVGKPKVVHSPQQYEATSVKSNMDETLASAALSEIHEVVPSEIMEESIKSIELPLCFELNASIPPQAFNAVADSEDISSFIGIPDLQASSIDSTQPPEGLFDTTIKETLNKQAAMAHYAQDVFSRVESRRDEHGSLGFVSTGTAEDLSSMEEHMAQQDEQASLGFISTETAEDFSSMEDYYTEKLATASVVAEELAADKSTISTSSALEEVVSDQSIRPVDVVVHRLQTESLTDSSNRWSIPDVDTSSSSDSYHKSFDKTQSRPLSSDAENLLSATGGTGTSSEYQTARDFTSTCREGTEYISAVSTLGSSSGKSLSSHESMRSLDSQSETSANLASIDVSELSETLVASSTEADALEAEELAHLRDLRADDDDSDESQDLTGVVYPITEQQSLMKRSQEMIFKAKSITEEPTVETVTLEEYPKPKESERTWGLAYPIEDSKADSPRESDKGEDILLYHGDARRSIDESKLASSLDEGSILSVSMSSTSNIDTVVENFDDMIGSAGSSSLTGIEGFQYGHDDSIPGASLPEDATFMLELESKEHSPQDSNASTPPSGESKRRGHRRSESTSISGDALKNLDKEVALLGEGKESESESDTDPYESEYARQFRSPKERKSKKKKQAAAEMDHSSELEKRPFTPSQLVAEVIVEDSATEELEAEALLEERRPSQNMQDYSNIPDIMVTEDVKSPILEEDADEFPEKVLYKVRTEEELHKASDTALYQKALAEEKEQDFQRRVQEQYKQKLEELKRAEVGADYDDHRAPDSPDSFEMVEQPDISDEFVIIEEVAKEANEVDLGGKSMKIKPTKFEQRHDEDVEKIIIKSAPADPKLGSQLYKDDLNFEFEESPPTGASSSSEQQEESDSSDTAAANKRWVEMQLTDNQLRYPYDLTGAVLEDIKEEDGEFEVGSSRISSFKDSFSSTPEYDVLAARRYHSRGEHDDVSMSSLQEFESLEQAISLENRNRTHQGSTDSSNGSFTRRYVVRHSGSGTAPGDDISISSLKEFEGLENACIEAHLIEIKAKEEAALLSRSDESNKSNGSDKGAAGGNIMVTKVTRTVTRTEVVPTGQVETIEALFKQKLERDDSDTKAGGNSAKISELSATEPDSKSKIDSLDSEKDSIDSMEISKSHDMMTSSIESFDISKDATTRSDIDSLEIDKRHSRQESIESFGDEQLDLMSKFVSSGGVTLGDGLTTTTTTTTTSTDADGHEHTVTRVITTTTVSGGVQEMPLDESGMSKDISVDSLNLCIEQTTSSAGTTATYQTSAGNSQMSGSVTSCASSTLMEDSFPGVGAMSSSQMSASFWSHDESTVVEDDADQRVQQQQQQQQRK